MKTLLQRKVDGHNSKLVLLDDNKSIAIILDNKQVKMLGGTTYESIKSDEWLKEALLQSVAHNTVHKKELRERMLELAKVVFAD